MIRWSIIALVVGLPFATATPLAGQQASSPPPPARAGAALASPARQSLPGPRLRPEWRSVQPSFTDEGAAGNAIAAAGTHTITVTTLVLVLGVIIAVLLIA